MLYIVATPIGNLKDISIRAEEVLGSVDYVVCEDTRHTRILLNHIQVKPALLSLHAHSSVSRVQEVIELLKSGKTVAYVSDAGTPGVADPGGLLAEAAHANDIPVVPIPGASSVTAALSASGFRADQFCFWGFLPKKKGRQTMLRQLAEFPMTSVIFESPQRIQKTVSDLHDILGEAHLVCICRELTKQFEEVWVGSLESAMQRTWRPQGEYVLVLAASSK